MKKPAAGKPAPPVTKPPAGTSPMRQTREPAATEETPAPPRAAPAKGIPMFPGGVPKPGGKPTPPSAAASTPVQAAPKKSAPPVPKSKAKAAAGSQARAVYTYAAQREDELSFNEGDVITVVAKNADGWWEGELHGARGVFPGNYVEETPRGKQVKSQWAYTAQRADELSFNEGDIIIVLEEKGNWHRGECNGKSGLFPAHYVVPG